MQPHRLVAERSADLVVGSLEDRLCVLGAIHSTSELQEIGQLGCTLAHSATFFDLLFFVKLNVAVLSR